MSRAEVAAVAYTAAAHLPAASRPTYEAWLARGGLDQLAAVLPAWAAGVDLPADAFRTRYFGGDAGVTASSHAREVGAELAVALSGPDGDKARRAAGGALAEMVRVVRPEAMGRVTTIAAKQAAAAPARRPAGRPAARSPAEQNILDLAAIHGNSSKGG